MLTLYRRHISDCPENGSKRGTPAQEKQKCSCPIWIQGTWHGMVYRKSLDVNSWGKAEKLKRQIEDGNEPQPQSEKTEVTIASALAAFIKDCEARNLNASTLRKYRRLERRLNDFGKARGLARCSDFTFTALQDFRSSWHLAPRTAGKELERLRAVFRYFTENDWIAKNPAKSIKAPQVKTAPRIPFTDDEVQKILGKAKDDRELGFLLTLRHTGLRIGDASLLKVSQVSDGRV